MSRKKLFMFSRIVFDIDMFECLLLIENLNDPVNCEGVPMSASLPSQVFHACFSCQVNEKPFEDLKHCTAALTRGVVKFAQVELGRSSAIYIYINVFDVLDFENIICL